MADWLNFPLSLEKFYKFWDEHLRNVASWAIICSMEVARLPRLSGKNRAIVLGIARELKRDGYSYQEIRTTISGRGMTPPSLGFLSKHLSELKRATPEGSSPMSDQPNSGD